MSRRSLDAGLKAANVEAVHDGAAVATTGIVIAAVVLVGGRLAIDDTISIGALVAAVGLAQFLVGPLLRIGYFGAVLGHARASAARVALVLASEPAVRQAGGHFDHEVRGALDVRDLHGPVLRGLDLRIDPGELVALAVTDPATAAELLAVLGRMVEPESGAVLVDQLDLRDLDLEIARAAVLVSHHDGELFSGTIRANVASAGEPGRDLTPALAAADADEVADSQPDGLDTIVTERGRSLSGGQKQRIVLARALAADPPVLVLHDPTTAVDAATEAQIAGALPRVRAGRTTLVLTTSPALLAVADRVLLVEHGRVVAEGRHDELTADARYREAVLR
jgi:putative ABC transport system ATP-binding protein